MKEKLMVAGLVAGLSVSMITVGEQEKSVPRCQHEDGSGQAVCVWDARNSGNGIGYSYLIVGDRAVRISDEEASRLAG